jgi:mRNA interferase MazF
MYRFASPDKQRPVVVLTRDSAIDFLNSVTLAPITSTVRGIPTEVILDERDGMKGPCAVNLDHVVTVPRRALGRRLTGLGPTKLAEVCRAIEFALGCNRLV